MKLTKQIYGYETDPKKTPFGLLNNQVRGDNIIQNAGWFNINGEVIGRGDLNLTDMHNIAKHLSGAEVFFVLSEADSTWDLPSHLDRTAPGFVYVVQKALWVICQTPQGNAVVRVRNDIEKIEQVKSDNGNYTRIPRRDIYKAFGYDISGNQVSSAPKADVKMAADDEDKKPPTKTKSHPSLIKGKVLQVCSNCGFYTCRCNMKTTSPKPVIPATKNPASIKTPPAPTKKFSSGSVGPLLSLPPKRAKIKINVVP